MPHRSSLRGAKRRSNPDGAAALDCFASLAMTRLRGHDMTIVYEKLMALDIPQAEQHYTPKDCMLYALGIGLGHDPMNEDELPFVYEKNLKVLPTMAAVLGYVGFWARDRDTGIDWVKIVNGEQGVILHKPLKGENT